nr:alpha/beta hydrolase [uncultured Lichenicoccus sp.]
MTGAAWVDLDASLRDVPVAHRMRRGERPVLMVHGIGPGTTGLVNFAPLIARLPADLAVHVIDLAGFGASGRLPILPFFDVGFWLDQIEGAIAQILDLHGTPPLLIGNSVGGALALKIAARRNDLPGIVAIGAPAAAVATEALRAFWTAPGSEAALADTMRPMTGAAQPPDPQVVRDRLAPFLSGDYGWYFETMLADPASCLDAAMLSASEIERIVSPITLLHGDLDRACPIAATLALRARLRQADLTIFGGNGHNLTAERPADIAAQIEILLKKVECP